MTKKQKITRLLIFTFLMMMVFSITAFAGDATVDILDNPRFEGAITWVNAVGKWVDQWFAAFISFVSFFIISASCLRNVLAGAYCVFPKFWDKVDEAHKAMESISISSVQSAFSGDAWKNTVSTGSITQFLMRCLPNIKVLTDFEDAQDPDYKQYFMRAIPQCVCAVFVGVFIYNGLYRDVMKVTSSFGSKMVSQAISTIKPEDILYKLTNISGTPPYPIQGAKTGIEHIGDVILNAVKGDILNEYTDQNEKKHKANMFQLLSNKCVELATPFEDKSNADVWEVKVVDDGSSVGVEPKMPAEHLSEDGMKYTTSVMFNAADMGLSTEYHKGEDVWIYATLSFTNKGASDKGATADSIGALTLHIPQTCYVNGEIRYKDATKTGGSFQSSQNSKPQIDGKDVDVGGSTLTLKTTDKLGKDTLVATGLVYESGGERYQVLGVKFESSGSQCYLTTTSGFTINCGDNISEKWNAMKNKSSTTSTKAETLSESSDDADDISPDD